MSYREVCDHCGEPCGMEELTRVDEGLLCEDCYEEYMKSGKAFEDYGDAFLESKEQDFLQWIFSGNAFLEPWRKIRFMKACWEEYKRFFPNEAKEAEIDFARSMPGEFDDFIREVS